MDFMVESGCFEESNIRELRQGWFCRGDRHQIDL